MIWRLRRPSRAGPLWLPVRAGRAGAAGAARGASGEHLPGQRREAVDSGRAGVAAARRVRQARRHRVRRGVPGREAGTVHHRGSAHRGMELPRPRDLAPAGPRLARRGRGARAGEGARGLAAVLRDRPGDDLHRDREGVLGADRAGVLRRDQRARLPPVRPRPGPRARVGEPVRRLRQHRLPALPRPVRAGLRRHARHRPRRRAAPTWCRWPTPTSSSPASARNSA